MGEIVYFYIASCHQNDTEEGSEVEGTILGSAFRNKAAYHGE